MKVQKCKFYVKKATFALSPFSFVRNWRLAQFITEFMRNSCHELNFPKSLHDFLIHIPVRPRPPIRMHLGLSMQYIDLSSIYLSTICLLFPAFPLLNCPYLLSICLFLCQSSWVLRYFSILVSRSHLLKLPGSLYLYSTHYGFFRGQGR